MWGHGRRNGRRRKWTCRRRGGGGGSYGSSGVKVCNNEVFGGGGRRGGGGGMEEHLSGPLTPSSFTPSTPLPLLRAGNPPPPNAKHHTHLYSLLLLLLFAGLHGGVSYPLPPEARTPHPTYIHHCAPKAKTFTPPPPPPCSRFHSCCLSVFALLTSFLSSYFFC